MVPFGYAQDKPATRLGEKKAKDATKTKVRRELDKAFVFAYYSPAKEG